MEKVKITRKQAEAIQILRDMGCTNRAIIKDAILNNSDIDICDLAIALKFGYEIEETKEDKVKWHYDNPDIHNFHPNSWKMGIKVTLDALNIKIKGVNDFEF